MALEQSTTRPRTIILLVVMLVLLLGMLTWANYNYLRTPTYVHRDFMSVWGGSRALIEDLDPYDPRFWLPLRVRYGSKWLPDSQNPFPLWTLVLTLPYAALEFGWGAAAWLTSAEVLLGLCVFLLAVSMGARRPTVFEFALIALGAYTFRGTLITLHNGQVTVLIVLALTLFLLFMKLKRPFLAGFFLSFIVIKPNPIFLLAPALALWLLWQRRWRVIAGGAAGLSVMLVTSWLFLPGWTASWMGNTVKTRTTFYMPTVWGVAGQISMEWAPLIGMIMAVIATAFIGWFVFRNPKLDVAVVTCIFIAGSLVVTPYAWAYEHMLLLVPLILLFTRISRPWMAWFYWLGLVIVLPWLMFRISGINDRAIPEIMVPLVTLIVLIAATTRGWFSENLPRSITNVPVEQP